MLKKLFGLSVVFITICFPLTAQYKKYRVKDRRVESLPDYIRPFNFTGWYVAPGITLTPKLNFIPYNPDLKSTENEPETYEAFHLTQKSKLGLYLEVGRYKLLSSTKLISYIDYGLSYKQLKGIQQYDLTHQLNSSTIDSVSHDQQFSLHNAVAHFNANHVIGFNRNFFIQNTLGANLDYSFSRKITTTDETNFVSLYQDNPSKLMAQVHYKFGLGFRIGDGVYLIPSVETPVLNLWKFEGARGTIGFFNSRYRPIIISLRIAWLTKPSCPKTWDTQDAKNTGGKPDVW